MKKKFKREKIKKKIVTHRERLYQYVKFYMDIGIVEPSIIEKKTKISRVRANYIIKFWRKHKEFKNFSWAKPKLLPIQKTFLSKTENPLICTKMLGDELISHFNLQQNFFCQNSIWKHLEN